MEGICASKYGVVCGQGGSGLKVRVPVLGALDVGNVLSIKELTSFSSPFYGGGTSGLLEREDAVGRM